MTIDKRYKIYNIKNLLLFNFFININSNAIKEEINIERIISLQNNIIQETESELETIKIEQNNLILFMKGIEEKNLIKEKEIKELLQTEQKLLNILATLKNKITQKIDTIIIPDQLDEKGKITLKKKNNLENIQKTLQNLITKKKNQEIKINDPNTEIIKLKIKKMQEKIQEYEYILKDLKKARKIITMINKKLEYLNSKEEKLQTAEQKENNISQYKSILKKQLKKLIERANLNKKQQERITKDLEYENEILEKQMKRTEVNNNKKKIEQKYEKEYANILISLLEKKDAIIDDKELYNYKNILMQLIKYEEISGKIEQENFRRKNEQNERAKQKIEFIKNKILKLEEKSNNQILQLKETLTKSILPITNLITDNKKEQEKTRKTRLQNIILTAKQELLSLRHTMSILDKKKEIENKEEIITNTKKLEEIIAFKKIKLVFLINLNNEINDKKQELLSLVKERHTMSILGKKEEIENKEEIIENTKKLEEIILLKKKELVLLIHKGNDIN